MTWTTKPTYPRCRHTEVAFVIKNVSFRDSNLHYAELYGYCNACKKHTTFLGIRTDRQDLAPSMTTDGVMVRLPFCCDGDKVNI